MIHYIMAFKNKGLPKARVGISNHPASNGKAFLTHPCNRKQTDLRYSSFTWLAIACWNKCNTMIHHLMSIRVTISFPNHTSFRTSTIEVAGFQPWDARIRPQRQPNMPIKASHLWWTCPWFHVYTIVLFLPLPPSLLSPTASVIGCWLFMILILGSYFWSIAWPQGCRVDSHSKKKS